MSEVIRDLAWDMCVAVSYKGSGSQKMQQICSFTASAVQPGLPVKACKHVIVSTLPVPRAAAAARAHTGGAIVVVSLGIV